MGWSLPPSLSMRGWVGRGGGSPPPPRYFWDPPIDFAKGRPKEPCIVNWTCPNGYEKPDVEFIPDCDPQSHMYNITSSPSCMPKNCELPLSGDKDADYTECQSKKTGEMCTPGCPRGYLANASISLVCTEVRLGGKDTYVFDAAGSRCIRNNCSAGPINDGCRSQWQLRFHKS